MRSKFYIAILIPVAVVVLVVLGLGVYDYTQRDTIAEGVTVSGVEVGGLNREQAAQKLRDELLPALGKPITVEVAGRTYRLGPRESRIATDLSGTIDDAIAAGRGALFPIRAVTSIAGIPEDKEVDAKITYSDAAVSRVVRRVIKGTQSKPVDAHIEFTPESGFEIKREKAGYMIDRERLEDEIRAALDSPGANRDFHPETERREPKVRLADLAAQYPTVIAVDRSKYKLTLYKDLKPVKIYGVAVGAAGLETPAGAYTVQSKQVNPTWYVPDSEWAGKLAGKVIPPGPDNPLVARWLGLADGVGIHGTNEPASIGSSASHGCIRMRPADVIKLYDEVPVGTAVYIS